MSAQTNSQAPASHHTNTPRRVLIVGGVAGGASCAARLRRLDETVEILMIDRGPYVSFANCGLPYYVGNVISDERRLLVASREMFHERFNIDVRTDTEVTAIDPNACTITTRDVHTGSVGTEHYDALVLSPGAAPIRPPLPGINLPGVFAVRTIPDSRRIRSWITEHNAKTAVVIGGGFIGLEMVENLIHRELFVAILEKLPQVMPPLDPEMAVPLMKHLADKGVRLHIGDGFASIEERDDGGLLVIAESGARLPADLVILAIGPRGGIVVDAQMRTQSRTYVSAIDVLSLFDLIVMVFASWLTSTVEERLIPATSAGAAKLISSVDPFWRQLPTA